MSAWQALTVYDNLSGEIHGSVKSAMLINIRYSRNAVNQHLAAANTGLEANRSVWVTTWGFDVYLKADGNVGELDNKSFCFMLDADFMPMRKQPWVQLWAMSAAA